MEQPSPFRFETDLDIETASFVMAQVLDYAQRNSGPLLVFDCERLHFIDSTGLSALERIERITGRQIVLRNVLPAFRRVLAITQLDELFNVEGDDT